MSVKNFVQCVFLLAAFVISSCNRKEAEPTCSNGLDYERYNDCTCPVDKYQIEDYWECRALYDPNDRLASNYVYIAGNIPSGFFKGHDNSLYFLHEGFINRSRSGEANNVTPGTIDNRSVKRLSTVNLTGYYKPDIYPGTYYFVMDLKQLPMNLGYNDAGESLVLTGTFTDEFFSKPIDDWKWHVVAANDTTLTPVRSYRASINGK